MLISGSVRTANTHQPAASAVVDGGLCDAATHTLAGWVEITDIVSLDRLQHIPVACPTVAREQHGDEVAWQHAAAAAEQLGVLNSATAFGEYV